MHQHLPIIPFALAAFGGCSKDGDQGKKQEPAPPPESAESATSNTTETAKLPTAKIWYAIPELGIQIELPGTPRHSLALTDVYEIGAPGCDLLIGKAWQGDDFYDATLETLAQNVQGNTVESFSKKEQNEDGSFYIEASYQTRNGQRWVVEDRIKVDNTPFGLFTCSAQAIKSADHAACVAHACASAKAL